MPLPHLPPLATPGRMGRFRRGLAGGAINSEEFLIRGECVTAALLSAAVLLPVPAVFLPLALVTQLA
ncbi:hypothetical protein NDU88_006023 [Pleurodeles waltl]|uniref:Uncharacterized protein n=1 Tax=Pleurodeles waltl TaxID=8319 RepID=A0AAV7NT09_PLEWA|nr:hypothetical protein NDU88_006023 [Pleurodeles waltl]